METKSLLTCAGAILASVSLSSAQIVIDDDFDVAEVSGWIGTGNIRTFSAQNTTQAGSVLTTEVIATQSNTNRGIASTASFDPVESGGFTLTFVVDSVAQPPTVNGFFLGLVGDTSGFYRDGTTRNFGLTFYGTEARTNSFGGFGLNFGDNFGPTGAELRLGDGDAQLASFLDGFTATIRADPLNWHFEITGLSDITATPIVFTGTGSWADAGTTSDALFGIDTSWHVVTSNQLAAVGTHSASFDRIRLSAGAEPPPKIIEVLPDLPAGELDIRWHSVEGRRYRIQRSTDLQSWIDLGTVTASAAITTFTDTDADDGMRHFYRIRLL